MELEDLKYYVMKERRNQSEERKQERIMDQDETERLVIMHPIRRKKERKYMRMAS